MKSEYLNLPRFDPGSSTTAPPLTWWLSLVLLMIPMLALLAINQYGLFALLFLVVVFSATLAARMIPLLYLVVLVPLSQPMPLKLGAREIGIYPEYFVLPLIFLLIMVVRLRKNDLWFEKTGIAMPWLGFLLVASLSLFLSAAQLGFSTAIAGIGLMYVFVLGLLMYLLVMDFVSGEKDVRKLLIGLFLSFGLVSIIGMVEFVVMYDPQFPSVTRVTSLFDPVFMEEGRGNPNSLGTFLSIFVILAVALRKEFSGWQRRWIIGSSLLGVVTMVLTGSRSSLLALSVALLVLNMDSFRKLVIWTIPTIVAGTIIFLLNPAIGERISSIYTIATDERILNIFSRLDPRMLDWEYVHWYGLAGYDSDLVSGAMRIPSWIFGVKGFLDHPLVGIGPKMGPYFTGMETSENLFLDVALMTGVLGLGMFAWICLRVFRIVRSGLSTLERGFSHQFLKGFRAILACLFIVSLTGSVLFNLKLLLLFWILFACLWRLLHPGKAVPQ